MHGEQILRGTIYCTPLTLKHNNAQPIQTVQKKYTIFITYNLFVQIHIWNRLIYYQSTWCRATRIHSFSGTVHWCCWNLCVFLVRNLFPTLLLRFVETKCWRQFVFTIQSVEPKSNLNKNDHQLLLFYSLDKFGKQITGPRRKFVLFECWHEFVRVQLQHNSSSMLVE